MSWSWIVLSIYSVLGTIFFIGYVLFYEGKTGTLKFERDLTTRENGSLQARIAQQDLIIKAFQQGWQRTAGSDPLAMTGPRVAAAPNTPLPQGVRRVRGLTTYRLKSLDEQPTYHMRSL